MLSSGAAETVDYFNPSIQSALIDEAAQGFVSGHNHYKNFQYAAFTLLVTQWLPYIKKPEEVFNSIDDLDQINKLLSTAITEIAKDLKNFNFFEVVFQFLLMQGHVHYFLRAVDPNQLIDLFGNFLNIKPLMEAYPLLTESIVKKIVIPQVMIQQAETMWQKNKVNSLLSYPLLNNLLAKNLSDRSIFSSGYMANKLERSQDVGDPHFHIFAGHGPRCEEDVVKLFDFTAKHNIENIVAVADILTDNPFNGQRYDIVNYFFHRPGTNKKFGAYSLKMKEVGYEETIFNGEEEKSFQDLWDPSKSRYAAFLLELEKDDEKPRRLIVHFLKTQEGTAIKLTPEDFGRFYENISDKSYFFVHCAAGLGRTGNLVLQCMLAKYWDQIFIPASLSETAKNIKNLLGELRLQRPGLVLEEDQLREAIKSGIELRQWQVQQSKKDIVYRDLSNGSIFCKGSLFTPYQKIAEQEQSQEDTVVYDPERNAGGNTIS